MKLRSWLLAGLAGVAAGGVALSAGQFNGWPILGGPAPGYCVAYAGDGKTCNAYSGVGESTAGGSNVLLADTGLANGAQPQTQIIPGSTFGFAENRLIGGDLDTNIAQRLSTVKGVASLAGLSPTAAVMTADGWWTIAAAAGVTVTVPSGTTEALPALGTTHALRLARTSSGAAGTMCVGQTLDQVQSAPLIGNNAVFSFWELNGAGQSASGGAFTVSLAYSSGTAAAATQATLGFAGSQGSKYALGMTTGAGGPTNMTIATPILNSGTTGTISSNVVTIAGSTTWTRYIVAFPVPTVIPTTTTAVTDVSVDVCFNPVATTAITTDWIELQGLQLEAKSSAVTPILPFGVVTPSKFQKRHEADEQAIDYSYWYYNFEAQVAGGINSVASCVDQSVTVAQCNIVFPVPMRIIPNVKLTSGFQIFTTTGYSAVNACTLAVDGTYALTPSPSQTVVQCTATTVPAAGTANFLTTLGTSSSTGIISASAMP